MLGFPQVEESQDEEESLYGRADSIDFTGSRNRYGSGDGIRRANIDPGKPWQNGSNESFNSTLRKQCLNAEIFASLTEARVIIEKRRRRYNEKRPHSSQNYITPAMAYFGIREKWKT